MKHVVLAVSYRAEMLEQEIKQQETKVSVIMDWSIPSSTMCLVV